ncbi:hypothetical protein ACOSP7_020652 [Xanthoceras sorbifolium]
MADACVFVVLEQLASVVGQQIQQEMKLLTSNFQTIQAVLLDAEERQVTETAMSVWLEKLKDVFYDMDYVLDKWNTAILQRLQNERAENAHKSKVCSYFRFPYYGLRLVILRHDIAFKIKAINERVDAIAKEREITSFVNVSKIFGRDEEKNTLISMLLCESCNASSFLLYNNNEVMSKFGNRIWVCASGPFDKLRIAEAINEGLGGDNSKLVELESVLQEISKRIVEKKFLLVLDDVWMEDFNKWEPIHNCLKNGLHGSKVLVTSRKKTTAFTMKLSKKHCWSLFRPSAFFGRSYEECEKLEEIGREIVSECKGLPLAAKTMGSLLCFKSTMKEWKSILRSEMWKLEEFEKCVFPPLLLNELIKLWMAQDYLGLEHNEGMETIGEKYFNSLAMLSFFQEFEKDDDGSIMRCKMHDIVHDVAQFLSKNELCMIEDKDLRERKMNALSEKARQLMLVVTKCDTIPTSICNFKKLRSLLFRIERRGLDGCYNLKELPQGIGKLINLRHLMNKGIRSLRYIPKGIERLTNIRTLSEFCVCSGDYGGKACSIERLNNFRHLKPLGIAGWENLRMDQIVEFKINKNICVLRLVFNWIVQMAEPMKDEAILEAFQPPPDLQRLTIERYGGQTMSGLRITSLTNLKWINLVDCHYSLHLPPLGKLPSLETHSIEGMKSVIEVGNEFLGVESDDDTSSSSSSAISFPKLKTLKYSYMWAWQVVMPSLRSLEIRGCYKLKGLPKQLLQMAPLQNLFIEDSPILKQLHTKGTGEKWQDISHIPNIIIT